jgi:hypothetical protein
MYRHKKIFKAVFATTYRMNVATLQSIATV